MIRDGLRGRRRAATGEPRGRKRCECRGAQARERLSANPLAVLMDVREDLEWQEGHAAQAVHLGKGVLERDLEQTVPDPDREIIMYCGGGYRSVLTAAVAKQARADGRGCPQLDALDAPTASRRLFRASGNSCGLANWTSHPV